jgi:PilZ domain
MEIITQLRRPPDLADQTEQRAHPRYEDEQALIAQIVMSPSSQFIPGQLVRGQTVDVSLGGLQFHCSAQLAPRTLLDLWVDASDTPEKFFLIAVVRWCRAIPNTRAASAILPLPGMIQELPASNTPSPAAYAIGAALRQSAATDHTRWRDYLERRHER